MTKLAADTGHTAILASYFSGLDLDDIPADVALETKHMLLDTLGCIIAARGTEAGPLAAHLTQSLGGGLMGEAYALGRLANAMDFEEGTPSGSHFGCGAVGSAMALARRPGMTGRDLLVSIAAGYEIGGRMSDAIGSYYKTEGGVARSFADVWGVATPVVFAAAGAAAKILGHDPHTAAHAFGLAGSSTPVPIGAKWAGEVNLPNTKYCDAGWCTMTGAFGAVSAALGSTGLATLLDGPKSLFAMVAAQNPNPDILISDLGGRWRIRQVLYKKWPCCRWIHYPLTALEQIIKRNGLRLADIDGVTAEVGFAAMSRRFVNPHPQGFASLQFSTPHAVAMVLLGVPPGPAWLSTALADDPQVRRTRDRVQVVQHHRPWQFPDFSSGSEVRRMCSGAVVRARGTEFRAETDFAFGDTYSDLRWSEADLIAKFRSLVAQPSADRIIEAVYGLERPGSLKLLLEAFDQAVPRSDGDVRTLDQARASAH